MALPLIVFDVNETLLDLETMEPMFARIFEDKERDAAVVRQLHHVFGRAHRGAAATCPSPISAPRSMKMLADTRGIRIDDSDKKELTEKFSTMPPHAEVRRRCASCARRDSGCSR